MAEYETTGPEIRKLVLKSARGPIAFAFNPGMDAKDSYLAMSKRKSPAHLHRVTKREGPGNKVASGKMTLDGREVVLTCDIDISALARRFKYYLAENGMSYKVRVLDKNGTLIDTDLEKATNDDDEDAPQAETAQQADEASVSSEDAADGPTEVAQDSPQDTDEGHDEAAPADDPETAALRAEFEALQPLLEKVQAGQDPSAAKAVEKLGDVLTGQLDQAESGRAAKTLKVLKKKLVVALRSAQVEGANEGTAA